MSDCLDCRCKEFEKCLMILNLMLDSEATKEQEAFFHDHIEKCKVCFAHYNIEKQLRLLIKTKVNQKPIPSELVSEIRNQIIG